MDEDPAALRADGKLAEAAAAYRKRGELATAEKLYADLWDFASAAEVARERGDRPAELGHLLSAQDFPHAARVAEELEHGTEIEIRRAADAFERHRRFLDAAALRERLGELPSARELYRRAHSLLDVARLERSLGRVREAGLAYEQLIEQAPDSPDADRARLLIGQLLLTLGRPEEAARHLQAAAPDAAVLEALMVAIDRLGWDAGVEELHRALVAIDPSAAPVATILERHPMSGTEGPLRLAGRYEVERLLGAGASGRVFLARDTLHGGRVAVKVLVPPHEGRAREGWTRFFAEARLVASLRHPNVVEVREVDETHGLLVMEYVAGGTLLDRLYATKRAQVAERADPLPAKLVRRMLLDVLDALGVVHARGVLHRDLKPANLFFSPTGDVKLGDFGAAHLFSEEATQTAGLIGTVAYMAPEQVSGGAIDFAADLYALGAVAFHALTGRLPFRGPDFVAQHLGDPPPRPTSFVPGLDRGWDEVIVGLLGKDPRARAASDESVRRLVERLRVEDDGPRAEVVNDEPTPVSHRARYLAVSPLDDRVSLGTDTVLGRPIALERFAKDELDRPEGAAHLAWLRAFARHAGPRVQRLFALVSHDDGSLDAVFEAPVGEVAVLDGTDRDLVARSLEAVHADGVAHGSISRSLVRGPFGPQLLLAGRAPVSGATIDDDRRALSGSR